MSKKNKKNKQTNQPKRANKKVSESSRQFKQKSQESQTQTHIHTHNTSTNTITSTNTSTKHKHKHKHKYTTQKQTAKIIRRNICFTVSSKQKKTVTSITHALTLTHSQRTNGHNANPKKMSKPATNFVFFLF